MCSRGERSWVGAGGVARAWKEPALNLPKRVTLRFSLRGLGGEKSHALVAVLSRRAQGLDSLSAKVPQWRLRSLVLHAYGRERDIPRRLVNKFQREELALQAERAAQARVGIRIPAEGF